MICRFAKVCKQYQPNGPTCLRDGEAESHCGTFRIFRELSNLGDRTDVLTKAG